MATRSLNKVQLIGNLTRDPELRYTSSGTAVCSFGLATNRSWTVDSGERKEEAEFHRIVSWNKLAELCSQLLVKGRKVYVEGRIQSRTWEGQDGNKRTTTEIVITDMIILDSRKNFEERSQDSKASSDVRPGAYVKKSPEPAKDTPETEEVKTDSPPESVDDVIGQKPDVEPEEKTSKPKKKTEDVNPDDIPF